MEIRDGLAQGIEWQIRQLALETTERFARQFSRFRRHSLLRLRTFDEYIHAPVIPLRSLIIQLIVPRWNDLQHFTGDIRFTGSTTYDEFNRYFARSKGIVRRFQQIDIAEPSIDDTIRIIKGLRVRY